MNPKTLCDQYTKEQLAEKVVELEADLEPLLARIQISYDEKAQQRLALTLQLDQIKQDNTTLKSENAELNKYLKHARDDKKIRLGEIGKLEEQLDKCAEFFEGDDSRMAKLEAVAEAAKHFAAAGYAEPQMDWRQPLLNTLADLKKAEVTSNENPQT